MPAPFDLYIAKIAADLKGGQATEHTYRLNYHDSLADALADLGDVSQIREVFTGYRSICIGELLVT